jgi:1,4-alpha-glucan branching enzyme
MLAKMPGDDWQKFAQLRAYYGFMWGYPGKKLLFMGQEFAQWREWSETRALDWDLLGHANHAGMQHLLRDLNQLYRSRPALHRDDCGPSGFEWLVANDDQNSVFAWLRKAPDMRMVAVIVNFTPIPRPDYQLRLPRAGRWAEIFNSDAAVYGGSGLGNLGEIITAEDGSAWVTLPSSATIMLESEP